MRASTRRGYRNIIENDLEIMPLMNLFVAMIPMLLISAVFLNVTVIDMKAPSEASASPGRQGPGLTVTIQDDAFVVEGRGIERKTIDRGDDGAEARLAELLAGISAAHPSAHDVIIVSEQHTSYGDIVAVMDISRGAGFPAASLLGTE